MQRSIVFLFVGLTVGGYVAAVWCSASDSTAHLENIRTIVQGLVLLVSVGGLVWTARTNAATKLFDTQIHYQQRYDSLSFGYLPQLVAARLPQPRKAQLYFERFWNLQREQFDDWCAHQLDSRTFLYWLRRRSGEFEANNVVLGMSYRDGWTHARQHLFNASEDVRFREVFDLLAAGRVSDARSAAHDARANLLCMSL